VEQRIATRMGDGTLVEMTRSEIAADLEAGSAEAVRRAKADPLSQDDLAHLLDIFASTARFVAVDLGREVMLSYDGTGTPQTDRLTGLMMYQECFAADSSELYHQDYSYKAVKTLVPHEQIAVRHAQERVTIPVHYGSQPDLGRYSEPDGPVPNWSTLLPELKIDEARAAQEQAVELAVEDMVHVAEAMWEAGADGINFDTAGAAGDGDLLAALLAVERLRAAYPDMGIMVGMAAERVLGVHGGLEFHGTRLAGLWPAGQRKVVEEAGATIFGPAVNVHTGRSVAWNVARAIALTKACCEESGIPVHMNAGMGVGGIPMHPFPPIDAVSRASKACVELLRLDGL
jgi:dimethylamine---corrinoid protein Co-methyltransferase